jgi:hypothetical protein
MPTIEESLGEDIKLDNPISIFALVSDLTLFTEFNK